MFKNMTIRATIRIFGVCQLLVVAACFVATLLLQRGSVVKEIASGSKVATEQVLDNAKDATSAIARDVLLMCRAQNEALQQKIDFDLNVARDVLHRTGEVSFAEETIEWTATNQYTKASSIVHLPKMMLGDAWLGCNEDISVVSPVVDTVHDLVGSTCTVFQRMNEAGDMLRVCTNVETLDHARAIGTYIPAANPDQTLNPVLETVLKGRQFKGRAFVVNAWYVTAYEPIIDSQGEIVGMLYVGVKQESVESLRKGVMDIVVGKTGYVFVLGGSGVDRGRYIISKNGARDGENIWEARDSEGVMFIQEMVGRAKSATPGHDGDIPVSFQEYPWKNQGEESARMKIAAVTYYEPWDWVIGAGTYQDDFAEAREAMEASFSRIVDMFSQMLKTTLGIVGALLLVGVLLSAFVASRISRPIAQAARSLSSGSRQVASTAEKLAESSQQLADDATEQASSLEETSASLEELTSMTRQNTDNAAEARKLAGQAQSDADAGNEAMGSMSQAINDIKKSADETAGILKTIEGIAFQTNLLALNAAVEAARAGDAGKGFAVVAEEVRSLAQRAAEAARSTGELITGSVRNAESGVAISKEVADALERIADGCKGVTQIISEVAAASQEQSQGIEQINTAVAQIDQVTQSNAGNSEESAAAAEKLNAQAGQMIGTVESLSALVAGNGADGSTKPLQAKPAGAGP